MSTATTTRPLTHDDLYALAMPSDPQLARDGSRAAWVLTTIDRDDDSYRHSIWTSRFDGEPPRQLTRGDADRHPRFSPDGDRLAFLSARDGGPAQVQLLPLDGGEARALTSLDKGATGLAWAPDGRRLAVTAVVGETSETAPIVIDRLGYKADGAGLLRDLRSQVFVVDVESGDATQLTSADYSYDSPVWSPDGRQLAVSTAVADDRDIEPTRVVHVMDVETGTERPVTPADGFWSVVDWSPDGQTLLVAGQPKGPTGLTRLATVTVDGGQVQLLTGDLDRNVMVGGPGYPGARPRFTDSGVVFCIRDSGFTHLVRLSGSDGDTAVLLGDDHSVSGAAVAGNRLLAVAATASSPGELYAVDGDGTQWQQLTRLFDDALPEVRLVPPQPREWTAPDGEVVRGWVLRDEATAGAAPTLLDVHGGPHNAWSPVFDGVHLYHQVLAAAGWNVLFINPRASDGHGERFWNAAQGAWGIADEQDFHAALDGLVAEGLADADRLAVTGYSYGGYMTCWLSARSDRFRAAVPGGAIVNMTAVAGTSDAGSYLARYEFGGYPWQQSDLLVRCSPMTYVDQVQAPTLILHGGADDRCPVGEAEQWFAALRLRQVPVQMVRYPGGSHLFILQGRPSHRVDYGRRLVDWVQQHTPETPSG